MDHVISEYQKWKQQGQTLRVQAKQAMEEKFRDLLTEAAQIAQEYQRDFGAALKPPPVVTAFRFKPAGPGKAVSKAGAKKAVATTPKAVAASDPKIAALQKQRELTRKKLDAAKAAGKPTKNLDDRLYEIEDELRLAESA